ncbi:MAG TPA: molybdopterin-binding protein [Xanthobacteraceae bacterium]|nr:molybdopterin-binding protein [Xanthobacteraceae bacterium]
MVSQPDPPQRIARLTPLAGVLARIDELVAPVAPRHVAASSALGHTAAGDCVFPAVPSSAIALRDGWAVRADLTSDASSYAPVPLLPDATPIDVGEPLPAGADAVAPADLVVLRDGRVELIGPVAAGDGVLPKGADTDRGRPIVREGQRVGRPQVAALAAAGVAELLVCAPRVRVVPVRRDPVIHAAADFVAGDIGVAGGLLDEMALDAALADAGVDAVVVVGGTGSGRHDASVTALARVGRVEAHGIALAPGETAAFGMVGSRPILLLPGRLDAALAVWLVIGRWLMARLCSSVGPEPATRAKLARKVTSTLGLAEVIPVRLHGGTAEPIASGYVPFSALAQADGWLLVPADSEGYPPGTEVVVRPL